MYRIIIKFLILLTSLSVSAQELSFKEIDSKTYELYMAGKWDELIAFGESIESDEIDYYYHNIRMGIACFNKQQFYSAEKYLLKAIANNNIDFPKQYLLWTYQWLGENMKADKVYDELSDETKSNLKYKKRGIEYLYLEGGRKKQSSSETDQTIYGKIALSHSLGGNARFTHAFNTYQSNFDPIKISRNQYHLMAAIPVNHFQLNIGGIYGLNGESSKRPNESGFVRVLNKTSYGAYVNYMNRFNRFGLELGFNYLFTLTDSIYRIPPPLTDPNSPPQMPELINATTNEKSIITWANMNYSPKLFNEKVKLGLENYFVLSEEGAHCTFRPYINISMGKKLLLNANYIHVGNYTFWDKTTDIIYNDANFSIERYAATLYFFAFSKTSFNLTYIYEGVEDRIFQTKSDINSIYLGILKRF